MTSRVPELPDDEITLAPESDLRIQRILAERLADAPDPSGNTPFQDLLIPRSVGHDGATTNIARSPGATPIELEEYRTAGEHRRPPWGRWIAAAAAAIVLVVAGALLVSSQRDPQELPTLGALAQTLGEQPDHPLAEGEYWYEESTSRSPVVLDGVRYLTGSTRTWVDRRNTGRGVGGGFFTNDDGTTTPLPDSENREWLYDTPGSYPLFGSYTYDEIRALPQDPQALDAAVQAKHGPDQTDYVNLFVQLARSEIATPGTRQASLEVLIGLGGGVTGTTTDPDGRRAITVTGAGRDGPWIVTLDPNTGVPLALYMDYPLLEDGQPDLESASYADTYGLQKFTMSTSG